MPQLNYAPEEIVKRGKEIYERNLASKLDTAENQGKFLVIDVETGEYAIDEDHLAAVHRLRDNKPEALLYGLRIGYPAVTKVGGVLRPLER